ncbi:MAG TPA: hypothetical protein VHP33_28290 [Polyangiaceae bacterium]|nr:hypothetical protein [Polyangiaceae bacterium]
MLGAKAALQELSHGFRWRGGKGSFSMLLRNFEISCASMQVAKDGVPQVGAN